MTRKTKRIISPLLICLVVILVMTGCTNSSDNNPTKAPTSEPGETSQSVDATDEVNEPMEPITLTYWIPFVANASLFMESYDDNVVFQHKEEITGVDIEFISPAQGDEATNFNLMIASNELPDMISWFSSYYAGGALKGISDGVIIPLNELIDENAPNFKAVIDSNQDIGRQVKTDDGTIWSMGMLEKENQTCYAGPTIRQDWLDDLGLSMPETIADWENVLTTFKNEKDATTPWILGSYIGVPYGLSFPWAYDVDCTNGGWVQRDGQVVYSFTDTGWLDYLTLMNKWYEEGLISSDFVSKDQNAWLTDGIAGAYDQGFWMFTIDENMIKESDPNVVLSPCPIPVKEAGDTTKVRILAPNFRGYETTITSSCETPAQAVEWLDWGYSDEGHLWSNYGEEGVSYTMVNGEPQWTEFMTNNEDGFDLNQLMNKYSLQWGTYVRDWQAIFVAYSPAANETLTLWDGDTSHLLLTSVLTFTADEGNVNATNIADIDTYVSEMSIKFINGEEPLSNWDTYVETIKGMGLDEVVANYQAAYDRYINR